MNYFPTLEGNVGKIAVGTKGVVPLKLRHLNLSMQCHTSPVNLQHRLFKIFKTAKFVSGSPENIFSSFLVAFYTDPVR